MSDLLEPVLRDTFAKRADQLDPAAYRRLMAVDYRPRRLRIPLVPQIPVLPRIPVLPALGAVGLAGAVAALVVVFTLGSNPAPAFAGWSAIPTPARPGQIARALAICGLRRPVLIDSRGPFIAAVFPRPNGVATCLQGPGTIGGGTAQGEGRIHAGQIQTFEQTASSGRGSATMLDGRVGRGVAGVRFRLSNGRTVTATVRRGWYLAWWPGRPHGAVAQITTAAGTRSVPLPAIDQVGAGSCGAAGMGCASVGPGASVGG